MNALKKLLTIKVGGAILAIVMLFVVIIAIISAITGVAMGYEETIRQAQEVRGSNTIINNQIYADRYRSILDKHLTTKGYVSLERLIFYLQRTHNVLDITTLSNDEWENAYLSNLNTKEKQMIPIKTICKDLKKDKSLPKFTVETGFNDSGLIIDVIDLCNVDGVDITTSNDYSESYPYLPFVFPLQNNFVVTSMVFESRNVDLGLSGEAQENVNFHEGWDFAIPIGTNFYSMCNGHVSNIVNTQFNDLSYKQSGNSVGNYISVNCSNGLKVSYLHIQANSSPFGMKVGSLVREGDLLGRTSTTGLSTGPHLHLSLQNSDGTYLDALEYVNFNYKKG